jgi:DNA-directed RNA polymerase subunit RPC12/RpoP
MAIKCPSCGGQMAFNVPTQALKCSHCDKDMQIEDYDLSIDAKADKDTYAVTVYKCPNCGAELSAPDEQTVAYCSYCGGESNLTMKQEEAIRPARIVPFKISKRKAVKTYEDALRYCLYVPKEFKEGKHLNSFRGIYIPYLSYEVDIPENAFTLKATKDYTSGEWDYHEKYDIDAEIGGTIKGISFDASSSFDDSIAREISPFNITEAKDFSEAYIAGFYSDKLTTPPETYSDMVEEMAMDTVYRDIGKRAGGVNVIAPKKYLEKKEQTGVDGYRHRVDLFPVWFLTWKNKGRVAYSVMNGQTGKLSMDIPVDTRAFFKVSGIVAAVLFVILSLIPMFILPKTISWLAAVFLMISSIVFSGEISKIYYRENHIFDFGNVNVGKGKQKKEKKKAKSPKRKNAIYRIILGLIIFAIFAFYVFMEILDSRGNMANPVIYAITFFIQIILFINTTGKAAKIEKKTAFIPMLIGIIVLGIGLSIGIKNPVYDYWYYGMAILCLLGMLVNMISMINYLNYLTTRPVPNFFRREGADHGK